MSIVYYKRKNSEWYVAIEIGQPSDQVMIGEGDCQSSARQDMTGTQFQSADFSCRAPMPTRMVEVFSLEGEYEYTEEETETYRLVSIKGNGKEVFYNLEDAIEVAKAMNEEYQSVFGVQVENQNGETVFDTEDNKDQST